MKKLFLILIVSILCLTGCKTLVRQSLCERLYPLKDSVSIITRTVTVMAHDTISLPSDSVKIWVEVPCPDVHQEVKKGRLTQTVDIKNGVLTAICKEDSLKQVINHLVNVVACDRYEQKTTKPIVIEKKSGWLSFCQWHTILSWVLVLVLGIIWVSKPNK